MTLGRPRSPALLHALRLVREGSSISAAARTAGCDRSAVFKALKHDARPLCPHCGQPVRWAKTVRPRVEGELLQLLERIAERKCREQCITLG